LIPSGVADPSITQQDDANASNVELSNYSSVSSKITDKDPITEAIETAPQSSYSYSEEAKASVPTENVCSTPNFISVSLTLHRKAAKRTFPCELTAEKINLATPPQVEDI
jgi:hypothetical protein